MTQELKNAVQTAKREFAVPTVSAKLMDGSLAEMVYRREENRTLFCMAKDGVVREESTFIDRGARLVPYHPRNPLLEHEVVLFAAHAAEYGSEQQLVQDVRAFLHRYVDVSPLFEQMAAYYVLFSWVYDAFYELPYLRIRGDAGSGKTRFLTIVGSLCYKPIFASAASTVSPLFRMLDTIRGTLVVDEGDFRYSDEKAELVKILNNGNGRGFPVLRTETVNGRELKPRAYQVYGPKLIATRGFFQDRALESRCLTEEMGGRRLRDDIAISLGDGYKAEALALRNQLLMFRFRNLAWVKPDPALVDRTVEPRLAQVFVPLMSIMDDAEARAALRELMHQYQREIVADRGMELEAHVLEAIHELQENPSDTEITVKEVALLMAEKHGEDFGRRITAHWVGYIIRRRLGLKTERRNRGYAIAAGEAGKLQRLMEKYGLRTPEMNSVNSVNFKSDEDVPAAPEPPSLGI